MAKFTKQAICASFMKFLEQKPLEQITVKDIVDDCDINRKTFYYYYQDLYALANDVFTTCIEQLKERMPPDDYSPRDALKAIEAYINENKKITSHVYKSIGYEKMNEIFYDASMRYLSDFVRKSASGLNVRDDDITMIASYNSIMLAGVLTKWISHGMSTVPTTTIDRLFDVINGCTRLALENADRLNKK